MRKLLNLFKRRAHQRDLRNQILDVAVLLREGKLPKRAAAKMLENIVFGGGDNA